MGWTLAPRCTPAEKRRRDAKKTARELVEFLQFVKPSESLEPGLKMARKIVRYFR